MHPSHRDHRYTGSWPMRHGPGPGLCQGCCQPSSRCCCQRECRKEPRSLLATATPRGRDETLENLHSEVPVDVAPVVRSFIEKTESSGTHLASLSKTVSIGSAATFIGGGCCVTLAVEYAPNATTASCAVLVAVSDAEGTGLTWSRVEPAGTGYRVHEAIITTKPGARLALVAINCTARVRWCEIFSC